MRIAVDAMGGEGGVERTVPASLDALLKFPTLALVLVGNTEQILPYLNEIDADCRHRLELVHTDTSISDQEKPAQVIRGTKQSSIYLATELVKQGNVQAMVSAGNTGALLIAGRHLLKTIPGIQKPAIVATLPGLSKPTYLLDVGANPDCDGQQLFEFAVMGSVLAESLHGQPAKVGLLNIGAEEHKGTGEVQAAATLMESCQDIHYVGFIEANDLFRGAADVVVCDGFVGNVTIKSSAGVANVVNELLTSQSITEEGSGTGESSVTTRIREHINPQRFNGASLLGLQGSIVKSHGNATTEGFAYAIAEAVKEVEQNVPQLIAKKVAAIMASV